MRLGKLGNSSRERSTIEQPVQNCRVKWRAAPPLLRRVKTFNPATKKLLEYGLVGLIIGTALVAGIQVRPQSVFPSQGTLQIALTDSLPQVQLDHPSPANCHGSCNATSLVMTIVSIEVHTSGINNMTGVWTAVCTKQVPVTVDVAQLKGIVKTLCNSQIQPETVTNIRLNVSSITANITGVGTKDLTLPSGQLEIPISPMVTVHAGTATTIVVDLEPHIVCQGNGGDCKLTPVLHAGPEGKD